MNSQHLLILSFIFPLRSISAGASSCDLQGVCPLKKDGRHHEYRRIGSNGEDIKPQRSENSLAETENGGTTNLLRSPNGQLPWHHSRSHLRNVHGILNIIGWGTLFPVGVIIARSFRRFPLKCEEWYNLHILCQTLGYIAGSIGWSFGIWLWNSSKQNNFKAHGVLGTIIFTFSSGQMLALYFQHMREAAYCRCWEIYHRVVGYALIAMIIANIFEGIGIQTWKWAYAGILAVLGCVAIALEILRCVKLRTQKLMAGDIAMLTSP